MLQLSIVHRLPQSYRWSSGFTGTKVELASVDGHNPENNLIGLKLLSHTGEKAWIIMTKLSQALSDIDIFSSVVDFDGEPYLFVDVKDEFAATCRLKNSGVAIAESFSRGNPF